MIKAKELLQLCQKLDKEYDARATVRDIAILCYLFDEGAKTVTEISFGMSMPQPVVSRFVKKLEEGGLVTRLDGKIMPTRKASELMQVK